MERCSVITVLRANIDKTVVLHFADGEAQTARIILVDDEGVVYDIIASNREIPTTSMTALWTTFDEIASVSPAATTPQDT